MATRWLPTKTRIVAEARRQVANEALKRLHRHGRPPFSVAALGRSLGFKSKGSLYEKPWVPIVRALRREGLLR